MAEANKAFCELNAGILGRLGGLAPLLLGVGKPTSERICGE